MTTVILCTYRRPRRLPPLLASLREQLPADGEVLVVDQSTGEEAEAGLRAVQALADPRFQWIARHPAGLPGARNEGLRRARGSVVVFFDDDVELGPACLLAHLEAYADPTVGGVVGRIVERRLTPNAQRTVNRVGRSGRVHTRLDGDVPVEVASLKGANMSWRRRALDQAGGFDEGYLGTAFLEESDLSERVRRLGWRLRFVPEAAVVHHHDPEGGVRVGAPLPTERWRFRNTGYFVARHRPVGHLPLVGLTFAGVALRRALEWRAPRAAGVLLRELGAGWAAGRRSLVASRQGGPDGQ